MNVDRRQAAWSLTRFAALTILFSALFSGLAVPWVHLPVWKIFRRCVSLGAAVALWISVKQWEHRSLGSFGLSGLRAGKRQFAAGVWLGIVVLAISLGIGVATGAYIPKTSLDQTRLWRTVVVFLPGAVLVSLLEELVFRGIILQRLLVFSRPLAVIASSMLYAVVHLKVPVVTPGAASLELVGLFLLGGLLSLCYIVTNQLYLSMGLHAALAYGVRMNKLVFEFPHSSVTWLMGNYRLANGVIGWVLLVVVAGAVAWWAWRNPRHHVAVPVRSSA